MAAVLSSSSAAPGGLWPAIAGLGVGRHRHLHDVGVARSQETSEASVDASCGQRARTGEPQQLLDGGGEEQLVRLGLDPAIAAAIMSAPKVSRAWAAAYSKNVWWKNSTGPSSAGSAITPRRRSPTGHFAASPGRVRPA